MGNLATVNPVLQHQIERAASELLTAILGTVRPGPSLAPYPRVCKFVLERTNRFEGEIAAVDVDHFAGLVVIDHQLAVFHVIPEWWHAPHPHALLLGGGDLVAH